MLLTNRFQIVGGAKIQRKTIIPFFIGALAGLGLSLLAIYARSSNHLVQGRELALESTFGEPLANGPRDLASAEAFLRDLLVKLESRPKDDPAFVTAAKKFVKLADFDPALAKTVPKQLPRNILVRADGVDVKIMMDWRLCGVAQVLAPQLLDPVRSAQPTVGCPSFGVWTEGAAQW